MPRGKKKRFGARHGERLPDSPDHFRVSRFSREKVPKLVLPKLDPIWGDLELNDGLPTLTPSLRPHPGYAPWARSAWIPKPGTPQIRHGVSRMNDPRPNVSQMSTTEEAKAALAPVDNEEWVAPDATDRAPDPMDALPHENIGPTDIRHISPRMVEMMAYFGSTDEEIALILGYGVEQVLSRWKIQIERGRAKCKLTLRRWQLAEAQKGNPAMLIWLGKNLLYQKDSIEPKGQKEVKYTLSIEAPGGPITDLPQPKEKVGTPPWREIAEDADAEPVPDSGPDQEGA